MSIEEELKESRDAAWSAVRVDKDQLQWQIDKLLKEL